jgi:uncharacterized protein YndB with AHSA1/START domain
MEKDLIVKNTITINAPAAKVWDALVNPEQTKKYMFNCEAVSDWKVGSPLLWKGSYNGSPVMVFVKGIIVDINPEKFLAYTTFDPNNKKLEDKPENYLTVTYELKADGSQTLLTATQGDYSKVGDGANRYKHTVDGGGWQPILEQIKKILEG